MVPGRSHSSPGLQDFVILRWAFQAGQTPVGWLLRTGRWGVAFLGLVPFCRAEERLGLAAAAEHGWQSSGWCCVALGRYRPCLNLVAASHLVLGGCGNALGIFRAGSSHTLLLAYWALVIGSSPPPILGLPEQPQMLCGGPWGGGAGQLPLHGRPWVLWAEDK